MNEFIAAYPQAPAALLALGLAWLGLAYWLRLRPVGDDVGARLDALDVGWVADTAPADRFERFEHRDYSGDRGDSPTGPPPSARWYGLTGPMLVPRWPDLYAETVARRGDPLGGAR